MWFKVHLGDITRMLVVIKKPGESLVLVRVGVSAVRQFCCVSARGQLMKGVKARLVLCDQGSASQLGHQAARRFRCIAEQAGAGRDRDIGGWLQRQQPERWQACGVR